MSHLPYPYERIHAAQYIFFSLGKTRIQKVVDFVPYGIHNVIHFGFGDLRPDGSIDDKANSNNGDIVKVLATIIEILREFTSHHPETAIYFRGSTLERTRLYTRIIKTYYAEFNKEFKLLVMIGDEDKNQIQEFDPMSSTEIFAFLIKRIV